MSVPRVRGPLRPSFLDVRTAYHPTSHEDEGDAYERVTRSYVGQVACLAGRLAAMPEGDSTVLDNSGLLFVSNRWSGSRHDSGKLPVLLVGGLGGRLKTGRVVDGLARPDDERKLCSLYLSLMDRMGVPAARFGDATRPRAGLQVRAPRRKGLPPEPGAAYNRPKTGEAPMTLALILLWACQDSEYVQKLDKVKYNLATKVCKDAEKRIDSDEAYAIERFTRIIDDPDLPKKECALYIQQTDQYDPPYAFLPYQYRARARLSLAAKASAPAEKKRLLEEAARDLEESLKRNVKSSAAFLQAAQAELGRLAAAPSAPAPADPPPSSAASLRIRQNALIAENRFRSARELVDREGAGLSAGDRADLVNQAEHACRNYLTEEMRLFRGRLQRIGSVAELRAMTKDEFEVAFDLPRPSEVCVAHPAYDWARRQLGLFTDVWAGRKPGSALLLAAGDASRLEAPGDNPWLKISGALAFQDLSAEVERRVAECADAPKARRDQLAAEIRDRTAAWTAFVDRLDPDVRNRAAWIDDHSRTLRAQAERQPRELAELDGEDLRRCFERPPVEAELQAFETKLRKAESAGGLARESRQKLYTLLVAARSFRLFLEGRGEAEVRRAVREDLENLARVGGADDPDRFGSRIRKVYDSLR